jgi:hypothetical protein
MNRPDEERNVAPEWIKTGHKVVASRLADAGQPLSQAA